MRLRSPLVAVGLAAAIALTGCAGGGTDSGSGSAEPGASLTIAKPDGAISTESNNPYLGDSSASKTATPRSSSSRSHS